MGYFFHFPNFFHRILVFNPRFEMSKKGYFEVLTLSVNLSWYAQCGKTQETVKINVLTKDLWNMNDYNVNKWFLK